MGLRACAGSQQRHPFGAPPTWRRDAMTTTQTEYFQTHAVDGVLTDEQMLRLFELPEGDTATADGGVPDAAADDQAADTGKQGSDSEADKNIGAQTPEGEADPDNAVILAKDGKHTIPFAKLEEARQGAQHWKAQAEAAAAELNALKAAAQQRADAGDAPTQADRQVAAAEAAIDAGVDPAIFGDFSEGDMAKGIRTLVQQQAQSINAAVEQRLAQVLGPLVQQQNMSAAQAHMDAIYAAHPDADSIAESKELAGWLEAQPSFARDGYRAVLEQGSTAQIIEFFDAFKRSTGMTQAPAASGKPDVAAAAGAAIAKAQTRVPTSLSDFPGGNAGPSDEIEAMRNLEGSALADKLMSMPLEKQAELMNRLM